MAVVSCSLKRYVESATVVKMSFVSFFPFCLTFFAILENLRVASGAPSNPVFINNGESHLAPDADNFQVF